MITRRQLQLGAAGAATLLNGPRGLSARPASTHRLIVDSQVHLWKANTPDRPWAPGARPQLPEPMTIERLVPLMDAAGVDRVVVVPPVLEGVRHDYGQEAAHRYPNRFATMARVDLNDPGEAPRVAKLREQSGVLGVRLNLPPALTELVMDGTADWFWSAAEQAEIPVMFLTFGQNLLLAPIAERFPRLRLIADHMGVTDKAVMEDSVTQRVAETAALARYPNVSVKLSSIPLFSKESYPWRDVTPHIQRLFDLYGPRRCHWGSDLTNTFVDGPYHERVTEFTEELPFLTERDKDWVMGKSIMEVLRWD